MVGAYVLADDHRTACAGYEAELCGYIEQNLALGQKMAKEMVPQLRQQIWFRNQIMRALPYLPWKGAITKGVLEPLQKAANAITLKDYPC